MNKMFFWPCDPLSWKFDKALEEYSFKKDYFNKFHWAPEEIQTLIYCNNERCTHHSTNCNGFCNYTASYMNMTYFQRPGKYTYLYLFMDNLTILSPKNDILLHLNCKHKTHTSIIMFQCNTFFIWLLLFIIGNNEVWEPHFHRLW